MKIATLRKAQGVVPAIQLSSGAFVDLDIAGRTGLLQSGPVGSTLDLLDDSGAAFADVKRLLDAVEGSSGDAEARLREGGAIISADDADLDSPVRPGMICSAGNAYRDHLEEMKSEIPANPVGFLKSSRSLNGPRDAIELPAREPDMVDYEGEFCVVFARRCFDVSPEEAMDHVAGYTMGNDVSSRTVVKDWLMAMREGNTRQASNLWLINVMGKQFPTFFPLGPVIVTKDEMTDPHNVEIGTRLNGELMQSANTGNLLFTIAQTISYFSRWQMFEPGDVLTTGSPGGVGFGRNPQVFLKEGDVVEVFGEGIGSLVNPVRRAAKA